jgi:hypothetical protein
MTRLGASATTAFQRVVLAIKVPTEEWTGVYCMRAVCQRDANQRSCPRSMHTPTIPWFSTRSLVNPYCSIL